jgi:hypothetical protein
MFGGVGFDFAYDRVARRQQLVEVFVDIFLGERAAQIIGSDHRLSPGFRA